MIRAEICEDSCRTTILDRRPELRELAQAGCVLTEMARAS